MRPHRRQLKNAAAEAMQFRRRAAIAFIGVLLALGGLALWYFRLQVWQHGEYVTRSEANRIKPRPVVPGRGLILDRKGRVLADNVPAYSLDVVPDDAGDPKLLLAALARIVALSPEDIAHFEQQRKATRGFRAITLKLAEAWPAGIPLSVTRTVMTLVVGPCASLGVHVNTPALVIDAPVGMAPCRAKVSCCVGKSPSLADAVKVTVCPSVTV